MLGFEGVTACLDNLFKGTCTSQICLNCFYQKQITFLLLIL